MPWYTVVFGFSRLPILQLGKLRAESLSALGSDLQMDSVSVYMRERQTERNSWVFVITTTQSTCEQEELAFSQSGGRTGTKGSQLTD